MVNTVELYADGNNITGPTAKYLQSLTITDKKGIKSDSMLMTLSDPFGELAEPDSWTFIKVVINDIEKGEYEVNDVSGDINGHVIEVSGTAMDTQSGIKARRSRTFEPLSIAGLVSNIAAEHGYSHKVDNKIGAVMLDHINQNKESDLNLLTRIAKGKGAIFKVSEKTLIFTNDEAKTTSGVSLPTYEISDPKITSGRWTTKRRDVFKSVKAEYFNEDTNLAEWATAGSGSPVQQLKKQFKSKQEAVDAAEAELKRVSRENMKLSLTIPLDVDCVAGCKAIVSNHNRIINGEWYIESAEHKVSTGAYDVTKIDLVKELD